MKRLANLKSSSSSDSPSGSSKKTHIPLHQKSKKLPVNNNPYPESGHFQQNDSSSNGNGHLSFSSPISRTNDSYTSLEEDECPGQAPAKSNKSTAPTVATNPETIHSDAGQSKAGTSNTVGGGRSSHGGGNSTFSSPNHSERSLTTTLTTIQSTAASAMLGQQNNGANSLNVASSSQTPVHFSHQYPVSPASAVPPHLTPQPGPHTYHAATANNMLTDNASILTLASSSKRRRRNSLDTNASVRALAPSSVWGGSRESLPLSVLSGNVDGGTSSSSAMHAGQNRPSVSGLATERVSVYSSSGVAAPALSSERNSYYANKQGVDGASVRSGLLGHGRSESISGSIGATTSPLASPRDPNPPGRVSRRNSDWKEEVEESSDIEDGDAGKGKDGVTSGSN